MQGKKPIIGILGGIGSGKSLVARCFGELGCRVIASDELVNEAYRDPAILAQLRQWWGESVFQPDGSANRQAISRVVFANPKELQRLEILLHPWVNERRVEIMEASADDAQVLAWIWDTPLLAETHLNELCDILVYVEAPFALRLQRVIESRGWDEAELRRRENLQIPLDKKREIADYVVDNTANADKVRSQLRLMLPRILETCSREV